MCGRNVYVYTCTYIPYIRNIRYNLLMASIPIHLFSVSNTSHSMAAKNEADPIFVQPSYVSAPMPEQMCLHHDYGNAFLDALNKMRVDHQVKRKLCNLYSYQYDNSILQHCDFCLEKEGEEIYVHKVALTYASPYFAAMLNSR